MTAFTKKEKQILLGLVDHYEESLRVALRRAENSERFAVSTAGEPLHYMRRVEMLRQDLEPMSALREKVASIKVLEGGA